MAEGDASMDTLRPLQAQPANAAAGARPASPALTISWDDGSPCDLRLADLLDKHQLAATFYVPTRNSEGRDTLTARQVAEIATRFEIGGHGQNHVALTSISPAEQARELSQNKLYLEEATGRTITGFCLVRGAGRTREYALARRCNFIYVRTILRARNLAAPGKGALNVTEQFYPHSPITIAKGFWRCAAGGELPLLTIPPLGGRGLVSQILGSVDCALAHERPFHLWGHSWEIDECGLWGALDEVLAQLRSLYPPERRLTNAAVFAEALGASRPGASDHLASRRPVGVV